MRTNSGASSGARKLIIKTKLEMENWLKDIVATNSENGSDSEEISEHSKRLPELTRERSPSPERDYLLTLDNASLSEDMQADLIACAAPADRKRAVKAIIGRERVIAEHRYKRVDQLTSIQREKDSAKLEELRNQPAPQLVPLSEVFRRRETICEDEELTKIKDKLGQAKAQENEERRASYLAQQMNEQAKALLEKQTAELVQHPEIRMKEFFQSAKGSVSVKTEIATVADTEEITEDIAPSETDALNIVHELILRERDRQANLSKANKITTELADMKLDSQPANVFERMWTPVSQENPIVKEYHKRIVRLRLQGQLKHRQLSACASCMTVFFPFFPADFHLHKLSVSFQTAIHEKIVAARRNAVMEVPEEQAFSESFTTHALVRLAKEAKAHMQKDGVEYIKLLRFVKGVRSHRGKGKYERLELCENCEVESGLQEEARRRFKLESLTEGILELIFR